MDLRLLSSLALVLVSLIILITCNPCKPRDKALVAAVVASILIVALLVMGQN